MQTKILLPLEENFEIVANALKKSIPIVFPTETVYGLGARLFDQVAISKIFEIKKRPQDNPLIAHISDIQWVEELAEEIPEEFEILAKHFFPGSLTIILKKNKKIPLFATSQLPTIAIRMPQLSYARRLIEIIKEPLVAPSANLSGRPSPTCVEHVLEDLDGKIPYIIDGGVCRYGVESTVIYLSTTSIRLLRPGAIEKKEIEKILNRKIETDPDSILSPGMKYRHYAPKAKLKLFSSLEEIEEYLVKKSALKKVILSKEKIKIFEKMYYFPLNLKTLFDSFRMADRLKFKEILVYLDSESKQNETLVNRLLKASYE